MPEPSYLGDAVYVSPSSGVLGTLMLTTGHHEESSASNVIIMEPEVVTALINYIRANYPEYLTQ